MNNIEISVVVPVYNEEENIDSFVNTVSNIFKKIDQTYEIIFILDPSSDDTEKKILAKKNCINYTLFRHFLIFNKILNYFG